MTPADTPRLRALAARLPGWLILAFGIAVFVVALYAGVHTQGAAGPMIVLGGPITLVACLVWLAVRASARETAALEQDPERGFAWSVHTDGPRVIWRRKAAARLPTFTRLILLEVWAYACLTLLLGTGYGVVVWTVLRTGGLRADDLPTAIPFAIIAVGVYVVIVRLAVNAFRNQVATEIVADRQAWQLQCTGVRPWSGGITTVSIPMASVVRVAQRAFTYRYATTVTVRLHFADRPAHMLARLSPADWERIGADLLPLIGSAGG